MKISQRRHRHAVDAGDDLRRNNFVRPNIGGQSVRVDFLDVKPLHAVQVFFGDELRRYFGQRQSQPRAVGFDAGILFFGRRQFRIARQKVWPLAQSDVDGAAIEFAINLAQDSKRYVLAYFCGGHLRNQVVRVLHRLAVELDHHVVYLQPGPGGRRRLSVSIRLNVGDDCALRFRQTIDARKLTLHRRQRDTQITALYFAGIENLFGNKFCFVRWQRKADAVVIAGDGRNLRIHTDRFAVHVNQRPATVAAIDRGVGLQKALKVGEGLRVALLL